MPSHWKFITQFRPSARFIQIYFLDDGLQINRRMEIFDYLHHDIVNNIQEVLESINALVRGFKSSRDVL